MTALTNSILCWQVPERSPLAMKNDRRRRAQSSPRRQDASAVVTFRVRIRPAVGLVMRQGLLVATAGLVAGGAVTALLRAGKRLTGYAHTRTFEGRPCRGFGRVAWRFELHPYQLGVDLE